MELVVGLVGVILGASLAPLIESWRHRRESRDERMREVATLLAEFLSAGGTLAFEPEVFEHSPDQPTESKSMSRMYKARWQLALLAPRSIDRSCDRFADQTIGLAKASLAAGKPDPERWKPDHMQLVHLYEEWKATNQDVVDAGRRYLRAE